MSHSHRKVRVLINPRSGLNWSFGPLQQAFERVWASDRLDLSYQYSHSPADGQQKARWAMEDGVDTLIVVGGDGMVHSIGRELVGTEVALGVIPTGSGNGFARHFGIPLNADQAVEALFHARRRRIDVGRANGLPFFVTCSMAWDAALVRTFEKSPLRGIVPYVFAAVYEFFGYEAHPMCVRLDDGEPMLFQDPVIVTAANLTQYGGGARIAPDAKADDGLLELVVVLKRDMPLVAPQIARLFDGTFTSISKVKSFHFRRLELNTGFQGPVQMDGELVKMGPGMVLDVLPKALNVLIPSIHPDLANP